MRLEDTLSFQMSLRASLSALYLYSFRPKSRVSKAIWSVGEAKYRKTGNTSHKMRNSEALAAKSVLITVPSRLKVWITINAGVTRGACFATHEWEYKDMLNEQGVPNDRLFRV